MSEAGVDYSTSFVVVEIEWDSKDLDRDYRTIAEATKKYLEDANRSLGGKLAAEGFTRLRSDDKLQYIVHYANVKSAERVLKQPKHLFKVDNNEVVVTILPCPAHLQKIVSDKLSSDTGSEDTASVSSSISSQNGELNTVAAEIHEKSSNGSSDIEIVSNTEANVCMEDESQHEDETLLICHEMRSISLSKSRLVVVEAKPEYTGCDSIKCDPQATLENLEANSIGSLEQWARSVIIDNVPEDIYPTLRLLLENEKRGGGELIIYERNSSSNQVLATFEALQVAENFLRKKKKVPTATLR